MKQMISGWTLMFCGMFFCAYGVQHASHNWVVLAIVCGVVGSIMTTAAWRE